jgi:hypothetical protein
MRNFRLLAAGVTLGCVVTAVPVAGALGAYASTPILASADKDKDNDKDKASGTLAPGRADPAAPVAPGQAAPEVTATPGKPDKSKAKDDSSAGDKENADGSEGKPKDDANSQDDRDEGTGADGGRGNTGRPAVGRSAAVEASSGAVRVKLPGSDRFVPVGRVEAVPMGARIDAREGSVTLATALPDGKTQEATFGRGLFEVRQPESARGTVDVLLRGGDFSKCWRPEPATARAARSTRRKRRRATVRSLWGKDRHGRYRTHGHDSVATVRGTEWLTVDRCDGTLTKVLSGAVEVRDRRSGRVVLVRAGHSYFARHR